MTVFSELVLPINASYKICDNFQETALTQILAIVFSNANIVY